MAPNKKLSAAAEFFIIKKASSQNKRPVKLSQVTYLWLTLPQT